MNSDTDRIGSTPGENDVDILLRTLNHPVRREVIRYFEARPTQPTASLEELVARLETKDSIETSDGLRDTLYQVHLPTLESRGWLDFDTDHETISYRGSDGAEQLLGEVYGIFTG